MEVLKRQLFEGDEIVIGEEKIKVRAIGSGWVEFDGRPQLHQANQILVGATRLTLTRASRGYRAEVAFRAPEGVEVLVLARDGDE